MRNGNNIPSKSKIQLMKKEKLIELCNELKISNDGNKSDLVSRVEEFYRPTQGGNVDVDISNGVPTKTDLRKMGKKDLTTRLSDNNLLTTGSRLELYKRLEEFYRPTEKTEKVDEGLVDSLDLECEDESVLEKNSSNTDTTLQIIEYNDFDSLIIIFGIIILTTSISNAFYKITIKKYLKINIYFEIILRIVIFFLSIINSGFSLKT